ncbi:MAG: amidohydrolase [Bacteroidota bacterium]
MKDCLNVSLVQPEIIWENVAANLKMVNEFVDAVPEETDLVILPETFATGFTMNARQFAEDHEGPVACWMKKVAAERNLHVTGSLIVKDSGEIYNRLFWVSPRGLEGWYDKRHLFRMGREDEYFRPGDARKVFTLGDFRILPQICYDLRFPVFARNRNDYDVLFYVANWPAPRQSVWNALLKARAIENQAYVLGVSRVGTDGDGVDHLGGTCVINPMGQVEGALDNNPGILHCSIDLKKIREFRVKFPVWKDADMFSLE